MLKITSSVHAVFLSLVIAASLLVSQTPAASAQLLSIQPGAGGDGRVGPASILKLTLADSSSNSSPQKIDSVLGTVVVDAGAHTSTAEILFEETGANTGVFGAKVRLNPSGLPSPAALGASKDVTVNALPGDTVTIRAAAASVTLQVASANPAMDARCGGNLAGSAIAIAVSDFDANRDPEIQEVVTVSASPSRLGVAGQVVQAVETGPDTGVFEGAVQTSRIASTTALHVAAGDTVTFEYRDEFPSDYRERVQSAIPADKRPAFLAHALIEADIGACSVTPSLAPIATALVREQATINATLASKVGQEIEYIAIFEVRNAKGFTELVGWQEGAVASVGNSTASIPWVPRAAGSYEVRVFAVTDMDRPQMLSQVATARIAVER